MELPEELLRANLWQVLSKAVSGQKKKLAGRVLITDSKKAYSRISGIHVLRRSVLAALSAWKNGETSIATVSDVMELICPDLLDRVGVYPWYENIRNHPLGHDAGDISIAAGVLRKSLDANDASR